MNKIKKVLLFAMSFVMATGLFTGCFMMPSTTSSSSESTASESSSASSVQSSTQSSSQSSTQSSVESSKESSVESSEESSSEAPVVSSEESSSEAPVVSSEESSEEAQKYNLTVVTGNPRLDPNASVTTQVAVGETVELPADPTAIGKTFTGWVDVDGNPIADDFTMPEEDVAIYATWSVDAYTLTIKEEGKQDVTLNFGVEAVPATETEAEIIDITILDFLLEEMYETSEGVAYEFEGKPETWALEDTTITVVATVAKYNFTVVTNKLTISGSKTTQVEYGTTVTLPEDPTAKGKAFAGWVDVDGNPVTEDFTMPGKDVTIYAVWEIVGYTLTITQEGAEDVTLKFGIEAVEATDTTEAIISVDELNSVLEGMLPEATETEEFVFEGIPEEWPLEDTTISIVAQNAKYWLIIQDGNPTDPNAYNSEELVAWGSPIELPTREDVFGKIFIGWFYTDPETDDELEAPDVMPIAHIRIYAKWELVTKTLTINKADGSVETYAIAVETKYDYFNPITGLDEIPFFLENIMTEPFSQFYTVSYEDLPETWELQDYTINEVAKSSIAYFDRLNKSWAEKTNVNNYWDGAENIVTVEHLADGVTKVGFDVTKFTDEQLAAADIGWPANGQDPGWVADRRTWVTYGVPVNGVNLHNYFISFEVKFENMKSGLNIFAMNNYVGNEGYDFVKGAEKGCLIANAEDLGDGYYRFTVQIPEGDVAGEAADYLLLSFDNTGAGIDKSLPSYAYIRNLALLCDHEYSTDCDPFCNLCDEERYDAKAHTQFTEEYISDDWGMHYQLCLDCGTEVNFEICETKYVHTEDGHYVVCDVCGYESPMEEHWIESGYTDEGHYDEGCYCGYIISEIIPHNKYMVYDEWDHWEACTDCGWSSDFIAHSGDLEMTENGHKVLGCDVCGFEGSDMEVAHTYGDWTVNAEYDWFSERECACGAKQVIKNRLDTPAQYFLVGEEVPTLDLTGIFSEGVDPTTVWVAGVTSTYTYWDYENGGNVEDYTHNFYAYNDMLTVGDDGKVTYEFDSTMTQAAPYFFGYKMVVVTLMFEDGATIDIPVTVTAVTKVIRTAEELQELGVGGGLHANGNDYGGRGNGATPGNDVVGYYLLGNDIDATGIKYAAGYVTGGSYFKGTFDGNGHTISNVIVSEGGIFGGMYDATVKNVNFANVEYHGNGTSGLGTGYNGTKQYGQYYGLFAHAATKTTITDVNIHVSALSTGGQHGGNGALLVYKSENGNNKFTNINIDAAGLMISNILGIFAATDKVTYTNIAITAAGYSKIGCSDSGKTALTELPEGITFEKKVAVCGASGAALPVYEGDVTALGFAEGTTVYKHTAPATNTADAFSVMAKNWVQLNKAADEDYASIQFVLGRDFNTDVHDAYAFFSWIHAMPEGATTPVYAAGGWLRQDGTTVASSEEKFSASANGFQYMVLDADGKVVTGANCLKANTLYTLRVYCDYMVDVQLCVYAVSGEPMDVYFANPSSGNFTPVYDRYDSLANVYFGDETALGFKEGTDVSYVLQDNRTSIWGDNNKGDLGKTMEQQCIKITKTAEEDYASIQFALSRDLTGNNAFFAWCYPTTTGGENCTTITVSKNGTGSAGDITVKVFDLDGNEVTNIEAGKAYEMRFYSETNIRFQIGCMEANGEYITTYFANPSSGYDA